MKNILVVSGHPNPSASLANKTILESLRTAFPQAQFRELASLVKDGHFDPVPEQEALLKADVIVLQFPFNWYSVPGLLKTWIDEVLLHGFAYGSGAKLSGKTVLLSITAALRRRPTNATALPATRYLSSSRRSPSPPKPAA